MQTNRRLSAFPILKKGPYDTEDAVDGLKHGIHGMQLESRVQIEMLQSLYMIDTSIMQYENSSTTQRRKYSTISSEENRLSPR